jgi:hypothetical protein
LLPLAVLILNLDNFSLPGHFHPALFARNQTMLWLVKAATAMTIWSQLPSILLRQIRHLTCSTLIA